jgi:hypothetical protein
MDAIRTAGHAFLTLLLTVSICVGQPLITDEPVTQATAPSATVTFQVGASGIEPLTYQWQRDPGHGFLDVTEGTNATLVVVNVRPWDACDYRVVVTDVTGATTSAGARLYVMPPSQVTTKEVLDNFDDNEVSLRWQTDDVPVELNESNQQFNVRGDWPDKSTIQFNDTAAWSYLGGNWNVPNGETLELRADLVGMSEHATTANVFLWDASLGQGYGVIKGRDFIQLSKSSFYANGLHSVLFYEKLVTQNTNVVMGLAMTRVDPNVIVTARILDKANDNAVLYQRSVVDTPNVDRTLTETEMEAVSGMWLQLGSEEGAPSTSVSALMLGVYQYGDGTKPAADVTFDNFELWRSVWRPEMAIQLPSILSQKVNLTLSAAPNSSWNIERALDLAGPWTNLGGLVTGPHGSAQFQDASSPSPAGFYRARLQ